MPRLLDRQKQIPGGFIFFQSGTGWMPRPWASLNEIAVNLISHRMGNPAIGEQVKWSTDYNVVMDELDEYNALHCEKMGWSQYITPGGGQAAPFYQPSPTARLIAPVLKGAAGARILVEWIASNEEAVPVQTAETRAAICAICPNNEKGDWTRFFTVPVANEIRAQLEKKRGWQLHTSKDSELMVCSACACPLPLKMWVPIERIRSRLSPEAKSDLDPSCWIPKE